MLLKAFVVFHLIAVRQFTDDYKTSRIGSFLFCCCYCCCCWLLYCLFFRFLTVYSHKHTHTQTIILDFLVALEIVVEVDQVEDASLLLLVLVYVEIVVDLLDKLLYGHVDLRRLVVDVRSALFDRLLVDQECEIEDSGEHCKRHIASDGRPLLHIGASGQIMLIEERVRLLDDLFGFPRHLLGVDHS